MDFTILHGFGSAFTVILWCCDSVVLLFFYEVLRVSDADPEVLATLAEARVRPGSTVVVRRAAAGGTVEIAVIGAAGTSVIDAAAASAVYLA